MSTDSNRARLRWASKKRKFRRRWPVYLVMLIVGITTVAIGIIIDNYDEPAAKAQPKPLPKAIR